MRIQAVFRLRLLILQLVRALRSFTVTFLVLGVLFSSLFIGKSILLNEVKRQMEASFRYESLRLSILPPALVAEEIQSQTAMPFFKARKVRVEIPYLSLLRRKKTIIVFIDGPEIRLSPEAFRTTRPGRRRSLFPLPFSVERGIIRDGEFFFRDNNGLLRIEGFMALFTQRGDEFSLRAEAAQSVYTSFRKAARIGGRLTLALSGKGEDLEISRITLEGPEVSLKGRGTVRDIRNPDLDMHLRFEAETAFALPLLDIPFDWRGRVMGEGTIKREKGDVQLQADLGASRIVLNGIPMGEVAGTFSLDSSTGGRLVFDIRKPGLPPEFLALSFKGGRLLGEGRRVFIDPVMREIDIPWPVKSPVWGTFSLEKKKLHAEAEFRDESLAPVDGRFGFRGEVKVDVDFREDDVLVTAQDLQSAFFRLETRLRFLVGRDLEAEFRGTIQDVRQARDFVSLVLDERFPFPEIRGAGYADIRLKGLPSDLAISAAFTLAPGSFDLFNAGLVKGTVLLDDGRFDGEFHVEDPLVNCDLEVKTKPGETTVDVRNGEGDLQTVFTALRIPASFQGRFSGDFRMTQMEESQVISGVFSSSSVSAFGLVATAVDGEMVWNSGILSFPRIRFDVHGGTVQGRFLLGTVNREFDMDLGGDRIDLASMDPDLEGKLSFNLAGRGIFGRQIPTGRLVIRDLTASPLQNTELEADLGMDYMEDRIEFDIRGRILPGANEFSSVFRIPLSGEPFSGDVKGYLENLDLVLPWPGVKGRLDFSARVLGTGGPLKISLTLGMQGPVMPVPGFAHAVTDYRSSAEFAEGRLTLTSLTGKLGGGDIRGTGVIGLGGSGVERIDMTVEGKDMLLAPVERMRGVVDGTVRLIKDVRTFVLEGDLLFKRLSWRRELYERFELSSSAGSYDAKREPSFFDGLSLNLRLHADGDTSMENSLGRVAGKFDLSLTGNIQDPILLGDIDILSGDIYFQDRAFRVIFGRLSFLNPISLEPYLDLRGETYVKDYRVTMNVNGPAGRLRPEFSSSPPLTPEEVLTLLALGETFRRTYYAYSYDRNTTLSTASLLSFQIADQAKKRAGGLFSLDRFRIDPFIPEQASTEIAARITVGKKIANNLLFIYSTVLASSSLLSQIEEVPIFRMEWDIRKEFSLIGGRDDRGKLSFDVKFRKRF